MLAALTAMRGHAAQTGTHGARCSRRRAAGALLALGVLGVLGALGAPGTRAAERIADVSEGTRLAVAMAPDGATLVVDLLGRLWSLPAAGGGATPLTPADERAHNPRFSPDGRFVVYERDIDGQSDLWLLTLATGERRPLTATPFNEREPDFTPDGRAVVFAGDATAHYCLWSIEVATGVRTQLTEEPGDASFPAVGPRGEIAYVLDRPGRSALRVLATTAAATELVGGEAAISAPTWRPGGNVLVYGVRDGRAARLEMLILSDPPVRKDVTGAEDVFATRAAWASPAEIVYAADGRLWRRGIAAAERTLVHLFAAVSVESNEPPTTLGALDAAGPLPVRGINGITAAPEGGHVAFTALGDLWLRERGAPRRLTDDAYVERDPAFTPDGESLIFASDRTGQLDLWRLDTVSGRATQLTFGTGKSYAPAVSGDGRRVAFLETDGLTPSAAARLRVLELADPTRVATFGTEVIALDGPKWRDDGRLALLIEGVAEPNGMRRGATTVAFDARGRELAGAAIPAAAGGAGAGAGADVDASDIALEWQPARSTDDYVVQIGRLFDGVRTSYLRHMDIHVEDGRIVAVTGRGLRPAVGRIVDLRDATIIPGLVDVHAHQSSLAGERLGRAWLAFGVTTVRELTNDARDALERGEAWASGRTPGPRLVISAGGQDSSAREPSLTRANPVPVLPYPAIADGLAHAVASQTRRVGAAARGRPLPAIAPENAGRYGLELSAGFVSYQDGLALLTASATVLPSTLSAVQGGGLSVTPARAENAYRALFDALERSGWSGPGLAPQALPALRATVARLIRGGGRVAVGSDAPAVPYGLGVHLELAALVAAGIPNDQALRLATIEGALALGLEAQLGTLEAGKLADFLVVDGDPLVRIADALAITAVVKGGVWFEREALLVRP